MDVPETETEQYTSPIPSGSPMEQVLTLLRSAALFPNTQAAVEFGTTDEGFYVTVSGDLQDGDLPAALQITFTPDGQLFDLAMSRHDQDGKIVCGNCSLQGDPLNAAATGWAQDEFGDTCPLCAGVEAVGPDSAGVEAIAEVLGADQVGEQTNTVNEMEQPPRPTMAQVRQHQIDVAKARAKSPVLGRKRS